MRTRLGTFLRWFRKRRVLLRENRELREITLAQRLTLMSNQREITMLQAAFPDTWKELEQRYHALFGWLPGDTEGGPLRHIERQRLNTTANSRGSLGRRGSFEESM